MMVTAVSKRTPGFWSRGLPLQVLPSIHTYPTVKVLDVFLLCRWITVRGLQLLVGFRRTSSEGSWGQVPMKLSLVAQ